MAQSSNPSPGDELDAQELLHLALKAMDEQRDAEAITLLKRGVAAAPEDGRMHYLLGAMHAQIGMKDRAIEEMRRAVQLAPHMDMAQFQLGLLLLTTGQVEEARQSWQALDRLDAGHPLALFRTGMLELAADHFDASVNALRRGIELNVEYPALNNDMERMILAVETARAKTSDQDGSAAVASSETSNQHVLLAGYRSPEKADRER